MTRLAAAQNSSGSNPGSSEATSRDADEVVLQLKLGESEVQYTLTRGDVRHLTLTSMAAIWKVLVEKIGVCLPEAGRDPQGRLAKRVAVRLPLLTPAHRLLAQRIQLWLVRLGRACTAICAAHSEPDPDAYGADTC